MSDGTEFSEVQEISKETPEVAEAKQQLERATIEPAAELEKVGDVKQSEDLEKEVVAAVEAAPKLETPPAVTLEGAGEAGKVTIERAAEAAADGGRRTEDREVIIDSNDSVAIIDTNDGTNTVGIIDTNDREVIINPNDGSSQVHTGPDTSDVAIIDTNDREVIINPNDDSSQVHTGPDTSDVAIIDTNDGTVSASAGDETVKIDTVPLPETPLTTADTSNRESIGTWPTPDSGGQDVQAEGASPTDTEESDGQDGTKSGEYDIQFEIQGDKTEMGGYSRIEGSETLVSFGDPEAADGPDQAAGVEAGAIAAAETDASEEKTTGTVSPHGSGIPLDDGGDTADGASPGGLEVGSVETAEQDIPETGEPTPVDEASSRSDIEEPTGTTEAEGSATLTNPSAVQTTHNITSVESGEQTISETGEPTSDTTEALENYSDQLSQFEKELELQQEDLLDLINDLKAEQLELTELQEQYDNTLANEPQPPSQEEFTDSNGGVDQNRKEELLDRYTESMKVYTNTLNILSAQITIKHDLITNIDGQITDKQAEIDKTQKDINKLLEIISNIQKPNNEDGDGDTSVHGPQDSIIQNIK